MVFASEVEVFNPHELQTWRGYGGLMDHFCPWHNHYLSFCKFQVFVIQNISSLTIKYIEQIRITISKTICKPELKIPLSPVGAQLNISENLNPDQFAALEVNLNAL